MKIQIIDNTDKLDHVLEFISAQSDCDRDKLKNRLIKTINHKNDFVLSANDDGIRGVFVFCAEPQHKYLEMLYAFSKDKSAYDEVFSYLADEYKGHQLDVIVKACNPLLEQKLKSLSAVFYPPQLKMVLTDFKEYKNALCIVPYDARYRLEYLAMHTTDVYWTGERVLKNPDIFKVFLAIEQNAVVGYVDTTYKSEWCEPYDLFVKDEYRNKGYGKALMSYAIKAISPEKMMLVADTDNAPAIHIYESMGFAVTDKVIQTVTLTL